MLIAQADTPEDMRQEALKLLQWHEATQRKEAESYGTTSIVGRRYALARKVVADIISQFTALTIMPKSEVTSARLTGDALIAPTLNLNGTSAEALMQDYSIVMAALREAEELLRRTRPHGRDFQTAPPGAEAIAKRQHEARITAVARCYSEIEEIALKVQDQQNERDKHR